MSIRVKDTGGPCDGPAYAACFAAALARLRKAELVTGDKEFKQVEGDAPSHRIRALLQ